MTKEELISYLEHRTPLPRAEMLDKKITMGAMISVLQLCGVIENTSADGHGHVTKRADGVVAKCGGPTLCAECAIEWARETWGASKKKTDWCPICKQGWDCHVNDQKSRSHLADYRDGVDTILKVMLMTMDVTGISHPMWKWIVDALQNLRDNRPIMRHPPIA